MMKSETQNLKILASHLGEESGLLLEKIATFLNSNLDAVDTHNHPSPATAQRIGKLSDDFIQERRPCLPGLIEGVLVVVAQVITCPRTQIDIRKCGVTSHHPVPNLSCRCLVNAE